ncbi:hypothetical protein AMJ74_00125 [candidate division WOR_3 bacterium SM1_77]|uniref:Uncharacterized protein n=1 Tax=candidate division WOR_3 bacterium SM1_77 TaxID=1703778 RepID=A0A0S8K270_UNCW3|nr:MAG: hypothetical protein AMJ74_00125 [candidate division WOR_3 bacterium SM1_77]
MQIIILASSLFAYIVSSATAGNSYDDIGQMPEIEINAPRYHSEKADSIGLMPGIVVFGERYAPQNEHVLFDTYTNYRSSFQSLSSYLQKYAVYILMAIITLTWGIIALTKIFHLHHEATKGKIDMTQLHEWVKRQQIKKLRKYEIK